MERHNGITEIVRFLDKRFTFTVNHQTPDIARSLTGYLEAVTIRTKLRHPGLIKLHRALRWLIRSSDLAVIECALRKPDPVTGRPRELMGEKMRILDAESGEDDFAFVGFVVVIRVAQKNDVRPVLHVATVFVRQNSERNGEAIREDARLLRAGRERGV